MPAFAKTLVEIRAMRAYLTDLLAAGRALSLGLLPALTLATEFRTWEVMVAEAGLPAETVADLFVVWMNNLDA